MEMATALALAVPGIGRAAEPESPRDQYDTCLAAIRATTESERMNLAVKYTNTLNTLRMMAQRNGDLARLKAAVAEIARFASERTPPAGDQTPPEIRQLGEALSRSTRWLELREATNLYQQAVLYDRALDAQERKLTQEGKIDAATAVEDERKALAASETYIHTKALLAGTAPAGAPPAHPARPDSPPAAAAPEGRTVNLLARIDPKRDAVAGTWTLRQDRLCSEKKIDYVRLQIRYPLPREYDFRIVFTVEDGYGTQGGGQVAQLLARDSRAFTWIMGARVGEYMAFEKIAGAKADAIANPTRTRRKPVLSKSVQHTSVVEVRDGEVRAQLDGELVAKWKTDYSDLESIDSWKLRGPPQLGVGSYNTAIAIEKLELVEISDPRGATKPGVR